MPINSNAVADWRGILSGRPSSEDKGILINPANTKNSGSTSNSSFPNDKKPSSDYLDLRKKIASVALSELQWWQNGPNHRRIVETDAAGIRRIISYWNNISGASAHRVPQTAWSAVFVSTCVKLATNSLHIRPMPLRLTEAHFRYAKSAYDHRIQHASFPGYYWAYKPSERVVQVGDIIVKERPDDNNAYHGLTYHDLATGNGAVTHGDIVTGLQPGNRRALVVGGNVSNSVTQKIYLLTSDGKIDISQNQNGANHIFAVLSIPNPLELKDPSYPPPTLPGQDMHKGYV